MTKILVVDDSRMARNLTVVPLEEAGYTVLGVEPTSLYLILKRIYEFVPDLVITDYQMPNCDGEFLVQAIRQDPNFGRLPIMVVTSHRDSDLAERLSQHGISGLLFKSSGMHELVNRVGELLPP